MPPTKVAKSKSPTTPPQEDARWKLLQGNCLDVLPTLPAMSIDSVVTDPPYELNFMGSKNSWDRTGIAFNEEMWRYVLRALKPGGHLLAFSGTRTYHRMACAIEDAGFEIIDCIFWCYGSGFPKSHNVSKAIDKMYGYEREKVRMSPRAATSGTMANGQDTRPWIEKSREVGYHEVDGDTAISEEAQLFQGIGSALKPALEPICLAIRPLKGSIQQNVREFGTGGLNIDACRIGASGETQKLPSTEKCSTVSVGGYLNSRVGVQIPKGRWPANLIHDGSDEATAGFPKVGASKRTTVTRGGGTEDGPSFGSPSGEYGQDEPAGSAARYFYSAKASRTDRDEGLDDLPVQNTGSMQGNTDGSLTGGRIPQGRNTHTTVKPTSLMQWLVRLITPPGGTVLDPFTGSGSTGKACGFEGFKFLGIEMTEEYIEIARRRILFGYTNKPKK